MADRNQDPEEPELAEPARSTADEEIVENEERAEEYRERVSSVAEAPAPGTMSADPEAEDATPKRMVDYYQQQIRSGVVAPSRTGLATRVRADLQSRRKSAPSEAQVDEIVGRILSGL